MKTYFLISMKNQLAKEVKGHFSLFITIMKFNQYLNFDWWQNMEQIDFILI